VPREATDTHHVRTVCSAGSATMVATKILYALLFSPLRATNPASLVVVDLVIQITLGGQQQPLIGLGSRNLPGGRARLAHKPDNLAAICEPII
jgi:hypothetical protein